MALNFNVKGTPSLNTRLYVSKKETAVEAKKEEPPR